MRTIALRPAYNLVAQEGYFPMDLFVSGSLVFVSGTFSADSTEGSFGGLRSVEVFEPTALVEVDALDTRRLRPPEPGCRESAKGAFDP